MMMTETTTPLFSSTSTSDNETTKHSTTTSTKATGRWTKEEHQKFIEGLRKYGRNWKLVEEFIGTRDSAQIRSHAQKFFNRLEREFHAKGDKKAKVQLESPPTEEVEQAKPQKSVRKYSDTSVSTYFSDTVSEEQNLSSIPEEPITKAVYAPNPNIPKSSMFQLIFGQITAQLNLQTKLADLVQMELESTNTTTPIQIQSSFKIASNAKNDPSFAKKLSLLRRPPMAYEYENLSKHVRLNPIH
jgi:SHAQKYF class myb-like DNA-binding protein